MPPKSRKKKNLQQVSGCIVCSFVDTPLIVLDKIAPKEEVQTINVGTSSKGKGKPEEIPREPSTGKVGVLQVLFCEEVTHVYRQNSFYGGC